MVIEAFPSTEFIQHAENRFSVRPNSKTDLKLVLDAAVQNDTGLSPRVLYNWCLTGSHGEHNSVSAFQDSVRIGYVTLITLIQAANELMFCDDFDLILVADGLRQLEDETVDLHAEKGHILGPLRNIPAEMPGTTVRCIDLSGLADSLPDWVSSAVVNECESSEKKEIVLLRSSGRYIEEFYELEFSLTRPSLREFGTVFITGGVGALPLEVAATIFNSTHAKLILTSRWAPPPRDQWVDRATMGDKIGIALKRILELESQGAEVLIVTADTTNLESLQKAVQIAETRFGKINGVIHCAGMNHSDLMLLETEDNALLNFPAKVHGAFNLEEIFAHHPLDMFIYFSSQASYLSSNGQGVI